MNFDTEKTINYWLEGAEYDMSVAEAMFETEELAEQATKVLTGEEETESEAADEETTAE